MLCYFPVDKMSASSKQQTTYATAPGFNGQKPTNLITHRSQTKLRKVPVMGKHHLSLGMDGKRIVMPFRVQSTAYSQKDEVLAPAPSTNLGNLFEVIFNSYALNY